MKRIILIAITFLISVVVFSQSNIKKNPHELKGETAPDWKLENINGDSISLDELKSKIILIQFTGLGCGPCHASIPFLKKLIDDHQDKDFQLLRLENWVTDKKVLQNYQKENGLTCNCLISNKKLKMEYKIKGVPVFFILDEKRVIRNVFNGFKKGKSEQIIIDALNQLL